MFFLYNDTATTVIYTLSLHDALPISYAKLRLVQLSQLHQLIWFRLDLCHQLDYPMHQQRGLTVLDQPELQGYRSEEHTSELQSRPHLVCRLLLEKKKKNIKHSLHQMA